MPNSTAVRSIHDANTSQKLAHTPRRHVAHGLGGGCVFPSAPGMATCHRHHPAVEGMPRIAVTGNRIPVIR